MVDYGEKGGGEERERSGFIVQWFFRTPTFLARDFCVWLGFSFFGGILWLGEISILPPFELDTCFSFAANFAGKWKWSSLFKSSCGWYPGSGPLHPWGRSRTGGAVLFLAGASPRSR